MEELNKNVEKNMDKLKNLTKKVIPFVLERYATEAFMVIEGIVESGDIQEIFLKKVCPKDSAAFKELKNLVEDVLDDKAITRFRLIGLIQSLMHTIEFLEGILKKNNIVNPDDLEKA